MEIAQKAQAIPVPSTSTYQNVGYPKEFEGYGNNLDLTFVCMLSEDPHKALEIAKNLTEIMQAKQAIAGLEAVSKAKTIRNTQLNSYK